MRKKHQEIIARKAVVIHQLEAEYIAKLAPSHSGTLKQLQRQQIEMAVRGDDTQSVRVEQFDFKQNYGYEEHFKELKEQIDKQNKKPPEQ